MNNKQIKNLIAFVVAFVIFLFLSTIALVYFAGERTIGQSIIASFKVWGVFIVIGVIYAIIQMQADINPNAVIAVVGVAFVLLLVWKSDQNHKEKIEEAYHEGYEDGYNRGIDDGEKRGIEKVIDDPLSYDLFPIN